MNFITRAGAAVIWAIAPFALAASPGMTVPTVTVGRNLQTWTSVKLPEAAAKDFQLTLTSDDPTRLLLSKAPDQPGSASITLTVHAQRATSPEFCLQALADAGTATYTISAGSLGSVKGTVNLARSGITIVGPFKAPKLLTTTHGQASRITLVSAMLDSSGKVVEEQFVAGGRQVEVALASSNSSVGALVPPTVTIAGGASSAVTTFRPAADGNTTITPVQPSGFSTPAALASVTATIAMPGIAVAGEIFLGKDLQTSASVCLGEPAPPGGLKVTLTSADPSKLVFSPAEDKLGVGSLTVTIPAGELLALYYIQALGSSGEVTYTATAPGFRPRTAPVWLTPSGVILAYERYGPPEEGNVLRKHGVVGPRDFVISRADAGKHPVRIIAWTAYLDPKSGRAADFTIEPLRGGVSIQVDLTNTNPAVGTVESPLTIKSGTNRAMSLFTPLGKGSTTLSVRTPDGFSTPANATSVPATVVD